jgi:transposase
MPAKRLSMRKLKEVLRLRFELELGDRAIGRSCSVSHCTVAEYVRRFILSGLTWPLPSDLDDKALEQKLFPEKTSEAPAPATSKSMPDMKYLHQELRRPGVTLQQLWEEYREQVSGGYARTQFYDRYQRWAAKLHPTLRQDHKAGEKVFVDWAGKKPEIVDPKTGEIREVELFVGVLGASSYTYAEATLTQQLPDWIGAHTRMLAYFGAVPALVVPDNTRTAVTRACRYEPDLNPTYCDWADHFGLAILPARVAKPRDKAKVENGVGVAERMILGGLRDQTFFSLAELNEAIREILKKLNNRKFQKLDVSRRELFEQMDRPTMRPLPAKRYEYGEWKKAKVNIDYHVEAAYNYYSVHYSLIHRVVEVNLTQATVEIWLQGRRVASHLRLYGKGRHQTLEAHRPPSHQKYLEWTPERILAWGRKSGPCTEALMGKVMASRKHPEQGFRSCLGILRLAQRYDSERLENACQRALAVGGYSYKSVKSILERGLDAQPIQETSTEEASTTVSHDNIRGKDYYH